MDTPPADHVSQNRSYWDSKAAEYAAKGRRNWEDNVVRWGIWDVLEQEARLLPPLQDQDVVELGCGTAYICSWVARRGGRPTGIDNSPAQLETARRLQAEFGLDFPLFLGDAEHLPFADASFDVAISEYGASIWCDPYAWIPEAARVLRPGGHLVFLVNAPLFIICADDDETVPAGTTLRRDYFDMHRVEWPDDPCIEFHLPHGDMVRLLRREGFEVVDLVELRPGADSSTTYQSVSLDWARRWPAEEVWVARRHTGPAG